MRSQQDLLGMEMGSMRYRERDDGHASAFVREGGIVRLLQPASEESSGWPDANLHFPKADTAAYTISTMRGCRCAVMHGGQGDVKTMGVQRSAAAQKANTSQRPPRGEYRKLKTRVVELTPDGSRRNARDERRRE